MRASEIRSGDLAVVPRQRSSTEGCRYLGDAGVVHDFVGHFANDVIRAYDGFLAATATLAVVQAQIDALVKEYGDALMGRDARYEIAPWQGVQLTGKFVAAIPAMKGDDDPGHALFKHLSLQRIQAAQAMARGMDEDMAGAKLKAILDDVRGRILRVIL